MIHCLSSPHITVFSESLSPTKEVENFQPIHKIVLKPTLKGHTRIHDGRNLQSSTKKEKKQSPKIQHSDSYSLLPQPIMQQLKFKIKNIPNETK